MKTGTTEIHLRYKSASGKAGKVHLHTGAGETACRSGWGPVHASAQPWPGLSGIEARLADDRWVITEAPVDCRTCLNGRR
jgi:hypothetical protein